MKKICEWLYRTINVITIFVFTWILTVLCLGKYVNYACKVEWKIGNIVLLIIGIGCIYLLKKILKNIKIPLINFNHHILVFGVAIIFFTCQLYIFYCIFFETGWDSGGFVIPAARTLLAKGDVSNLNEIYFKTYPNNVLLVHIYYLILKINEKIGIFKGTYQLMAIVVCNCFISSFSCILVYFIGEKKVSRKIAWMMYIWMLIVIGLSPWNVICYSDALVLFFPICIIYIYMNEKINVYIKYSSILILGYIGYCIKPQALIVVIAIGGTEIIRYMREGVDKNVWKTVGTIVITIIVICMIPSGLQKLYKKEGFVREKNREFGITHFVMMGMNEKSGGIWSGEDVEISDGCKTSRERTQTNVKVVKKRLKEYGWNGYLKFLSKKMLTNYNDGTFAWGREGSFYYVVPDNVKTKFSDRLKEIYYNDGTYYKYFSTMEQFLWVLMLGAGWYTSIKEYIRNRSKNYGVMVMELSIIGITLFELLFEARARYIYLYVPIFAIFVLMGMRKDKKLDVRKDKEDETSIVYSNSLL